jgi:hypothetical protein
VVIAFNRYELLEANLTIDKFRKGGINMNISIPKAYEAIVPSILRSRLNSRPS